MRTLAFRRSERELSVGLEVECWLPDLRRVLPKLRLLRSNEELFAAVAEALGRIGLQSYAAAFDSEGFDDIEFLLGLDSAERAAVATATGMDAKPGHAGKWVKFGFGKP